LNLLSLLKDKTTGLRPAPRKLFEKSLNKNFDKNREMRAIFGDYFFYGIRIITKSLGFAM